MKLVFKQSLVTCSLCDIIKDEGITDLTDTQLDHYKFLALSLFS